MNVIAAPPRDTSSAALMADQAAMVIAGMLFGGCDLGELAPTAATDPSPDAVDGRDQENGIAVAIGDLAGCPSPPA